MSNEIKTRPLTPTEQKYTYAQSMQLEGQTGTIGHLRGDFATTGYSTREIAVYLDITEKAVYRRMDRLKEKLKKFFE